MKMIADIARDALELPPSQRLTLARILLDCADDMEEGQAKVDEAWDTELSERIASIRNGTVKSRSMAAVFSELDRRYPG
ncbi:MAG: addiction module protein [Luteolibacter sp.]